MYHITHMFSNLLISYFFAFQNTWASVLKVLKLNVVNCVTKKPKIADFLNHENPTSNSGPCDQSEQLILITWPHSTHKNEKSPNKTPLVSKRFFELQSIVPGHFWLFWGHFDCRHCCLNFLNTPSQPVEELKQWKISKFVEPFFDEIETENQLLTKLRDG